MAPAKIFGLCALALALACGKDTAATVAPGAPAGSPPAAAPGSGSASVDRAVDPLADLDARVDRIMRAYAVPGLSLAIVKDGEVVAARGYGVREQGKDGAVDEHTVFAIASNTKAFIGTVLALLDHEDAIDLNERVKDRLPWFDTWSSCTTSQMRIRDLVTHSSGLATWAGDLVWIGSTVDTKTLLSRMPSLPSKAALRERYGYSNIMFVVAGEVIAAVTKKPWDQVVRERLLVPIGMNRTTTSVAALSEQTNVATPHAKHGDGDVVDVYLPVDNAGAAAALNSSAADMARWLRVQLGGGRIDGKSIVPPEVIDATRVPQMPVPLGKEDLLGRHFQAYGLGWFLYDYRGRQIVTHGGGLPGMTSRVAMVPEEGLGVVVLTNSESSASALVALDVIDGYLGGPQKDLLAAFQAREKESAEKKAKAAETEPAEPAKPAKPEAPLAVTAIRGTYANPLLGRAEVTEDGGVARLHLPDHGGLDCPLQPGDGPVFHCTWANGIFGASDVHFQTKRGRATSLRFSVRPEFIDPLEYTFTRKR